MDHQILPRTHVDPALVLFNNRLMKLICRGLLNAPVGRPDGH